MPKPSPTQEENDKAAMGEHVFNKEPDGSELDVNAMPAAPAAETRQMEAKPAAPATGYQTRQARPAARQPAPEKD